MMTKALKTFAVSACLALATLGVQAQAVMKIGYVNSERVLRESQVAKAAQTRLESDFSRREKALIEEGEKLKAASDKLDKEAPTLSESEKLRRQRDLIEQDRELQRKRREFQEDLTQRRNEELASVVERANKVIKSIFDEEKYDVILQDVVFASPRVDITDKVIKALNAQGAGK